MKFPKISSPLILAPMSGICDIAFRQICRDLGAGLTVAGFVSSTAVIRENAETEKISRKAKDESPCAIQLFGNTTEELVDAGKILSKKFDVIDINCGCPAYKILKQEAGSSLLKTPERIGRIVSKLTDNIKAPITVKIRSGIDKKNINAVEVAKICESAGASAITVHGRTQKQGYSGKADWNVIRDVKNAVSIPVIGNGDVRTAQDVKSMLESTGCDYVMIGRKARNDPFIFKRAKEYINTSLSPTFPTFEEKINLLYKYFILLKKYKLDNVFVKVKTAQNFTHGFEDSSKIRLELAKAKSEEEIKEILERFKSSN